MMGGCRWAVDVQAADVESAAAEHNPCDCAVIFTIHALPFPSLPTTNGEYAKAPLEPAEFEGVAAAGRQIQ